ncbi:MAG: hypothetical protein EBX52_05820 [Proteobacteria bacterium]|nr:hypothetical protein [Pseudomonadota bacterium]
MPHLPGMLKRLSRKVHEDFLFHSMTLIALAAALYRAFHTQPSFSLRIIQAGFALILYAFVVILPDRIRWILRAPRFHALGYGERKILGKSGDTPYEISLESGVSGFKSKGQAVMRVEIFAPGNRRLLGTLAGATPLLPVRHHLYRNSIVLHFKFEPERLPETGFTTYQGLPNFRTLKEYISAWTHAALA